MLIEMSTMFNFYLKANGSTTTKVYKRGGCGKRDDRKVGGGLLSKPPSIGKNRDRKDSNLQRETM